MKIAALASALLFASVIMAGAENQTPQKLLTKQEEGLWIEAVNNHVTTDGATVLQVLKYTTKIHPQIFKFAPGGVGYDGETGEPDGVGIGYWIGAKRMEQDTYIDLFYSVSRISGKLVVTAPKNEYTTNTAINALEGGRNSFSLYINRMYKEECIDAQTQSKLC